MFRKTYCPLKWPVLFECPLLMQKHYNCQRNKKCLIVNVSLTQHSTNGHTIRLTNLLAKQRRVETFPSDNEKLGRITKDPKIPVIFP